MFYSWAFVWYWHFDLLLECEGQGRGILWNGIISKLNVISNTNVQYEFFYFYTFQYYNLELRGKWNNIGKVFTALNFAKISNFSFFSHCFLSFSYWLLISPISIWYFDFSHQKKHIQVSEGKPNKRQWSNRISDS